MSIATLAQHDVKLREAVLRQVQWDPEVDAAGIGVTTDDGAVT